jgi:transcriptional regulator with XRE-family HTH domain
MPKPIHRPEYRAVRGLLRELRVAAGMKQSELSALLGKPQPYVSSIETGQRRVDLVEIRDICTALGTTLPAFTRKLEIRLREPDKTGQRPKRTRVG